MASESTKSTGLVSILEENQGLVLPITVLMCLIIVVVPLPTAVMDLLLSINILLSVLVLVGTMTIARPIDFSVFPTVLLATTLYRLVLNIATTRLILTNAAEQGSLAAGHVVDAFGNFVAGGNLILGIVIFIILFIVQFVVINKGSVRTSEVAARFALDGMPGRQIAVDADLNAGTIDEKEAKARREEISQMADFYGAMDGASKFVRGDAIAGILITAVNIVGGLTLGVFYYNMPVAAAAEIFTRLTIGDGLVTAIPAILLSLAAGFLVTRQSKSTDLGKTLTAQLFTSSPQALNIAGGSMASLAMLGLAGTGLPAIPLSFLAACCFGGSYLLRQEKSRVEREVAQDKALKEKSPTRPPEKIEDALKLDALELEVGYGLIPLADRRKGGDLEDRIVLIRKQLAIEFGMILPGVRLRDNPNIEPNDYLIRLKGIEIDRGTVYPGHFLAIDTGTSAEKINGLKTKDPLFGQDAYWIDAATKERAELLGYSVIEAAHVLTTHLTDTIKRHGADLLNRERVSQLIDVVKQNSPKVVEEVVPDLMKIGDIQRVLQGLLREGVSIRDMESILETIGDYAARTKDPDILIEYVRHRLSRSICEKYRDTTRTIHAVTMDPATEDMIAGGIEHTDRLNVKLSPVVIRGISEAIASEVKRLAQQGRPMILLVGPTCRAGIKQMTMQTIPNLIVLSYNEITRDTRIEAAGMVSYQQRSPARQPAGAST
ncbi:flagellar biosynthesis protein FlhA [bacterium]|nr:flagellar biosynthesis protein FlhA [bacterium]